MLIISALCCNNCVSCVGGHCIAQPLCRGFHQHC